LGSAVGPSFETSSNENVKEAVAVPSACGDLATAVTVALAFRASFPRVQLSPPVVVHDPTLEVAESRTRPAEKLALAVTCVIADCARLVTVAL
jgi:hypothetical protein